MKKGYSSRAYGEVRCISNFNERWICIGGEKFFIIDHNSKERKFKKENSFHPGGGMNSRVNHVEWNKKNQKYILTAPFNGNVVLWDLGIRHGKKIGRVYDSHKELVHQVRWSPKDPNTFYSSSKDRTVRVWDIRDKGGCRKSLICDDMVYGIDVNPFNTNIIVAGTYSAKLLVWDLAKPEKPLQTLESSVFEDMNPVYSVRFHPKKKNLLCSGGRDKILRIWNLQRNNQVKKDSEVKCISDIKRCEWQPGDSSGLKIAIGYRGAHHKMHFYDLNFPFIPQYEYFYGIDNLLDFVFLGKDKICTVSKSGRVTFKYLQDGENVRNSVRFRKFGCQWNVFDQISQLKNDDMPTNSNLRKQGRKRKGSQHSRSKSALYSITSRFGYFKGSKSNNNDNDDDDKTGDKNKKKGYGKIVVRDIPIPKFSVRPKRYFEYFAHNYKIFQSDVSVVEKCRHNANVARRIERRDLVQLWEILEKAYVTRQKFKGIKEKVFQEKKKMETAGEEVEEQKAQQEQEPQKKEEEEEVKEEEEEEEEVIEEEKPKSEEIEELERLASSRPNKTAVEEQVQQQQQEEEKVETSGEGEEEEEDEFSDDDDDEFLDFEINQMMMIRNRNLRRTNDVFIGEDDFTPSPASPPKNDFFSKSKRKKTEIFPKDDDDDDESISISSSSSSSDDDDEDSEEEEEFFNRPSLSFHMKEDQMSFREEEPQTRILEQQQQQEEELEHNEDDDVVVESQSKGILKEQEKIYSELLIDLLNEYCDQGDVQTCVAISFLLQENPQMKKSLGDELGMGLMNNNNSNIGSRRKKKKKKKKKSRRKKRKKKKKMMKRKKKALKKKFSREFDDEEEDEGEEEEEEEEEEEDEEDEDEDEEEEEVEIEEMEKRCIMPMIPIPESRIIDWTVGYIEILNRFRLYHHSTELIKMNCLKEVKRLHQFLEMRISCGLCHKTLDTNGGGPCSGGKGGPGQPSLLAMLCRKCNSRVSRCLICNLTVRDQYYLCSTCGNGGHLRCFEKWFKKFSKCPMCLPMKSNEHQKQSIQSFWNEDLGFSDRGYHRISSSRSYDFQLCDDLS